MSKEILNNTHTALNHPVSQRQDNASHLPLQLQQGLNKQSDNDSEQNHCDVADKGSLDRNFDPIADHFANKVYGGLKGDIRLAVLRHDLTEVVTRMSTQLQRPLRILDIGAGLAQLSIEFCSAGHEVTINDISQNMIAKAQLAMQQHQHNSPARQFGKTTWIVGPYQALQSQLEHKYDLILCHALLEWLDKPQDIMFFFKHWLQSHGKLSLCFYNPASFVYRNLIMGNFNLLNNTNYQADNKKSLTPNNPVSFEMASAWLTDINFGIASVSGLRVFHDYAPLKRGGHQNPADVIEMEVRYSGQAPYKWLGRYLHVLAYSRSAPLSG